MSIVFAGIVPHPPLLIPNIGRENLAQLAATTRGYAEIGKVLKAARPDTVVIISPHGPVLESAYTINQSPEFEYNFQAFGDFATKGKFPGDIGLAHKMREGLESTAIPLTMATESILDHGSAVPLAVLGPSLGKVSIVPLFYSGLGLPEHYEFGRHLQKILSLNSKSIAVIASGDLSHRLTRQSPAGYSPKARKFDQKVVDLLTQDKRKELMELDPALIAAAGDCGLRSIAIMLGIIDQIQLKPTKLAYEAPFGVGYLTFFYRF